MKLLIGFNLKSIIIFGSLSILFILVFILLLKRKKNKERYRLVEELDYKRNKLFSAPILSELKKVETIVKNEKMGEQLDSFNRRFKEIKETNLKNLNDQIIALGLALDNKNNTKFDRDKEQALYLASKTEYLVNSLLTEISDINSSEEKYRTLITRLKAKYRELLDKFEGNIDSYLFMKDIIKLQFENIEKRFQSFEDAMDQNDYGEVAHVVKAIDTLIDYMVQIVEKTPELVGLSTKLLPKKIEDLTSNFEKMIEDGFILGYLEVPQNMKEALKKINNINDRMKTLDYNEIEFELKNLLEYLDNIYKLLEDEKVSRYNFEKDKVFFEKNLLDTNLKLNDLNKQLDDIQNLYDLREKDVFALLSLKKDLLVLNTDYKKMTDSLKKKEDPFSLLKSKLDDFSTYLKRINDNLKIVYRNLGNMYKDEQRAKKEYKAISEVLDRTKEIFHRTNFPYLDPFYYTELREAEDALKYIKDELKKSPITIKTLNLRVDTGRDLALKIERHIRREEYYCTYLEKVIVYGNRFIFDKRIKDVLDKGTVMFYKGEYEKGLDTVLTALSIYNEDLKEKVLNEKMEI